MNVAAASTPRAALVVAPTYGERLAEYARSLDISVSENIIGVLQRSSVKAESKAELIAAAKAFVAATHRALERFRSDCAREFEGVDDGKPRLNDLALVEAGVMRAIDLGLGSSFTVARELRGNQSPRVFAKAAGELRRASGYLDGYETPMPVSGLTELNLGLPNLASKLEAIRGLTFDVLLRGKSMASTVLGFDVRTLLRRDSEPTIAFTGWSPETGAEPNAIYVVVGSHDYGVFDVISAERLGRRFGESEPVILTTAAANPVYKIKERDPNIVFIEDHKPIDALKERVLAKSADVPQMVFVAPEGTVPRFFAQFPLVPKRGGFVAAQRIAKAAPDRPVYLVAAVSNALEHLTSRESVPVNVHVHQPERVPTDDATWVERARAEFGRRVDQGRAPRIVDLANPEMVPGFNAPFSAARAAAVSEHTVEPLRAGCHASGVV